MIVVKYAALMQKKDFCAHKTRLLSKKTLSVIPDNEMFRFKKSNALAVLFMNYLEHEEQYTLA